MTLPKPSRTQGRKIKTFLLIHRAKASCNRLSAPMPRHFRYYPAQSISFRTQLPLRKKTPRAQFVAFTTYAPVVQGNYCTSMLSHAVKPAHSISFRTQLHLRRKTPRAQFVAFTTYAPVLQGNYHTSMLSHAVKPAHGVFFRTQLHLRRKTP